MKRISLLTIFAKCNFVDNN